MSLIRASLVLLALGLTACGVRGAPAPAPPLLGETDLPPFVPQPYQRSFTQTVNTAFAPTLEGFEETEGFPETLPPDRSIRSANPQQVETGTADAEDDGETAGD